MEYHSAFKWEEVLMHILLIIQRGWMDERQGYYAKWNKPVPKGWIWYDSTYSRCPEQSNSETEEEWWLPGAGERRAWGVTAECAQNFSSKDEKCFRDRPWW